MKKKQMTKTLFIEFWFAARERLLITFALASQLNIDVYPVSTGQLEFLWDSIGRIDKGHGLGLRPLNGIPLKTLNSSRF